MELWHKGCALSLPQHYLAEALINISWDLSTECSLYSWRGSKRAVMGLQSQGFNNGLRAPLQGFPYGELSFWVELCLELFP